MPRIDWYAVPGYREAVERETAGRDSAFIPIEETLCGIPVLPFNLTHWLILGGIDSPFLCGGEITAEHTLRFLWVVSTEFTTSNPRARDRFIRRCVKRAKDIDVIEVRLWLDDAILDAPGGGSDARPLPASFAAFVVDAFASEYGWSEQVIMRMPCKKLFQLMRCMRRRNDHKAAFINPSDKIKSAYLRSLKPEKN